MVISLCVHPCTCSGVHLPPGLKLGPDGRASPGSCPHPILVTSVRTLDKGSSLVGISSVASTGPSRPSSRGEEGNASLSFGGGEDGDDQLAYLFGVLPQFAAHFPPRQLKMLPSRSYDSVVVGVVNEVRDVSLF